MPNRANRANGVSALGAVPGAGDGEPRWRSPETGRFLPMPPRERPSVPLRLQRRPAGREARRAYIAPLFVYCASHGISVSAVGRQAAMRQGVTTMGRTRLWRIKNGHAMLPGWFIAGMCLEIGQPVETVMGQEWAQQHMPPAQPASDFPSALPEAS